MIEIIGLSKKFGDKTLFDDLNLEIGDGDFVVFCGKSGCGKTTLLNMIGGLEKPDHGKIVVDGEDIWERKNRRMLFAYKFGYLFQNFALLEDETVLRNLEIIPKKARSELTAEEALSNVGLSGEEDTPVYKLSGGEQQRVALARLMMKKCDIIFADEPTGSLDVENADLVMGILHQINSMGRTVILVTHNERIIDNEEKVIRL